jgi:hypothetical protein
MKKGFTRVVAAEKIRVGRCHGQHAGRLQRKPQRPSWRLWLECGHMERRTAVKPPRSVKCDRCELGFDRDYPKRGGIPKEYPVIRM